MLRKFGNLSIREVLVCDVSVRPSVCPSTLTDSGEGGEESRDNPTRGEECHLFLAGDRAVFLGNRRFSWREITWPPSLLKKRFFESLFSKTIQFDRSEV